MKYQNKHFPTLLEQNTQSSPSTFQNPEVISDLNTHQSTIIQALLSSLGIMHVFLFLFFKYQKVGKMS